MPGVTYLVRALMLYADTKDTSFFYVCSSQVDDLYHFGFVGRDWLNFCIYVKTNTLYLNGTNLISLPRDIRNIIQKVHDKADFHATRNNFVRKEYCKEGEDTMKKEDSDTSKSLDERAKLKIKIRKDVDTLSKDIVKKHSLDSAHSKADKIAKRIMKSMH